MTSMYWRGVIDGLIVALAIIVMVVAVPEIIDHAKGHLSPPESIEVSGEAEFEVLLGSANTGPVIYGTLRIESEDIPKFFDGHTWRLLPPPPPEKETP